MKNTDKNASKAKRSLMAKLAELFGFRRERSLPRSEHGSRHRAAEAGNVFFTLFGAVAVVGVLGAGIMSTMRGPLTTMVEVNRIEETKAQSRMNARLILLEAASNDTHCGSTDDVTGGGSVEFTEAIPYAAGTGPTGGGVIPGGVDGAKNDPWGQAYGYCVWNNGFSNTGCANTLDGQDNLNAPAISIVSGGPDRTITTTCAQAGALNIQGDDIVETLTYSEAVSASGGLWTDSGSTIDSGKALNVTDAVNDSTFGAGASFAGDVTLATGTSVAAPSVSTDIIVPYGVGTTVSLNANTFDVNADGDISGTLTVGGATTISNTLTVTGNISDSAGNLTLDDDVDVTGALDVVGALDVSGSITDTSDNIVTVDDALSVTGAADITGNFAVNTNMFTVDATTGDTVVAGTAELNGKTIIRGDGTDDTTNALEIWNAAATPLELMSVDDAGNMTIAGRLLTGGFDETVSIYGTTTDGSTDPLVIYDSAATPVPVFSVDTDGHISIDGATNGNMLIATGTEFSPVAMSGDATISSAGALDLAAGAVDNDEIADGAVDTDEIADGAVTGAKIGLGVAGAGTYDCLKLDGSNIITQACGSGGGGDGVGTDGFTALSDTPSAYAAAAADADKLVVVNPTGDGLIFADAATIVPPADRLEDRADTANSKPIDTYIDVDTSDDGADNSIVFVNDGTQNLVLTATGGLGYRIDPPVAGDVHLHEPGTYMSLAMTNGTVGATVNDGMEMGMGSTVFNFALKENLPMQFWTNTLQRLRIDAAGGVGIGSAASADNDPSALFEMGSTTQGFLAPRLTNAQATTLAAVPPATGLLIFNTEAGDNGIFQFWDGSAWVDVGGGGAATGGLWEPDGSNDYIEYDDTLGGVRIGRVTGQPAPATDWLLDVTNSVVYTTANKVGINSTTISPGLNLDITGNIGATNYCDQDGADCFSAADIATLAGGGGVDSDRIEDGGDANTYVDADPADDDSTNSIVFFNAGSQSMVVDADGELGIGITDPQSTLHLNTTTPGLGTDMSALNKATAAIRITEGGNELFMDSNTIMNEGSNLLYGVVGANDLIYYTTATERMRILSTGAVGINNVSPQTQLDVTGTIRIGDGSELCNVAGHEGAMRYVAASDTYQVCADSATGWEDLFSTGTGAAGLWTDIGANRIHYGATGFERVGIATTSPITTLDVNGGVRIGSVSGNAPTYLSLNSLSDVDAAAPANNQVLTYNSGSGNWEPYSSSSLVNSVVLNDISNVNVPSPSDGDVLSYDTATSRWVAVSSVPSADTLAGLSCNANELARWNGTAWVCSSETNVDTSLSLQFTSTGVSGGSWSAVGSTSAFGHNTESYTLGIALLDSTTMAIAYRDGGANTVLTTFELSGGTWSEIPGAALDLGSGQITLNMDKIANNSVILSVGNGASGNATAYTWNGSTWSLANASAAGGYGVGAAMTNNLVAYYNNLNGTLYALSWNGSTFTTLGSINLGFSADSYNMDQLDNNTIVILEEGAGLTDQLHVYRWTGATWTQLGSSYTLPIEAGGYGRTFIANASNIVTIGESNNLYTYSWDGATWTPSGTTTAIGDASGGKMVMLDSDSAWHLGAADVIQQYDFSATVANSTIADANTTGQLDSLLNIGDRFLISRTASNNRVFTVTNIPNADTINVAENALDEGPVNADITVLTNLPNALDDLSDVDVTFVGDQDCLIYNDLTNNWEAGSCDPNGLTQEWTDDGSGNIYNTDSGTVGINTGAAGVVALDVNGTIRIADGGETCDGTVEGAMRYSAGLQRMEFCDGANWQLVAIGTSQAFLTINPTSFANMDISTSGNPAYGSYETFTVTNVGGVVSQTMNITLSNPTNFDIGTDNCDGNTLAAGASCTIQVRPAAYGDGTYSGILTVSANNSPVANMSGTASSSCGTIGNAQEGGLLAFCTPGYRVIIMPPGCANDITEPTCSGADDLYMQGIEGNRKGLASFSESGLVDDLGRGLTYFWASETETEAYHKAANFCNSLTLGGYTDWYLPTGQEFESYLRPYHPLLSFENTDYIMSDTNGSSILIVGSPNAYSGAGAGQSYDRSGIVRCIRRAGLEASSSYLVADPPGFRWNLNSAGNPAIGSIETFTITNNGTANTGTINSGITNTGAGFEIMTNTCNGANLAPGGTCTISARPTSTIDGTFAEGIFLDAPNAQVAISMEATFTNTCGVAPGASHGGGELIACKNGYELVTTPGNCGADPNNPTCNGLGDTLWLQWSTENYDFVGTNSRTDGSANQTDIMARVAVAGVGTYPAAEYCDALDYNGYNDWYLPSQFELMEMCLNRANISGFSSSDTLGNAHLGYLSSTEKNATQKWVVSTNGNATTKSEMCRYDAGGAQNKTFTSSFNGVRCVRRHNATPLAATLFLTPSPRTNMDVIGPGSPAFGSYEIFTLSNNGSATSAVISTSLTNTTNFEFGADTCNGTTLAPAASCQIQVRAKATGDGGYSGSLSITANNSPVANMSGTASGFGSIAGSVWTATGNDIYNINTGKIGIGTGGAPNQYSMLDITSTDSGVLLPRMTTAQRDAMDDSYGLTENGMMIYNTTNTLFEFWDGDSWESFSASAGSAAILQDADPDTSINVDTAGDGTANSIVFTNNSAETMRITSAGNVGVGTSSPGNKLTVSGDVRSNSLILNGVAGYAPTYTAPNLALNDLNNVSAASPTTNDVLSWNGTAWVNSAGGGGLWTENGSDIYFDSGLVGIGTTTPSDDLHIYDSTSRGKIVVEGAASQQSAIDILTTGDGATNIDDSAGAYGWQLYTYNNTWANAGERNDFGISYYNSSWQTYMYMDSATNSIGLFNASPNVELDVTGSIEYTGTLADVSDIRLKKDIKPLNTDDMIQRIMNVDTYTFVMKDDEAGQIEYGVMAQEIEKIFPELVRTANDDMGTKSVNYVGLIAPMIEATKSLKAENEALKAEIADIKTAQADILEEVKGIARHTGYGMEKGDMMYLFAAMMIMMLSGFGLALVYRRQGSGNKE